MKSEVNAFLYLLNHHDLVARTRRYSLVENEKKHTQSITLATVKNAAYIHVLLPNSWETGKNIPRASRCDLQEYSVFCCHHPLLILREPCGASAQCQAANGHRLMMLPVTARDRRKQSL